MHNITLLKWLQNKFVKYCQCRNIELNEPDIYFLHNAIISCPPEYRKYLVRRYLAKRKATLQGKKNAQLEQIEGRFNAYREVEELIILLRDNSPVEN